MNFPVIDRRGRAFGGGQLAGDNLVRIAYLDEGGISQNEPVAVVAGVVVHGDKQWARAERELNDLAVNPARIFEECEEKPPPNLPEKLFFHAKDIWHGSKQYDRDVWPLKVRMHLLKRLCEVPRKIDLPIVWGRQSREIVAETFPDYSAKDVSRDAQTTCFAQCVIQTEMYMRFIAAPDEIATLVVENNDQARARIKETFHWLKDHETMKNYGADDIFPIKRIIDTPHFAEKSEANLLQLADICAFVIKRFIGGDSHVKPHYAIIEKNCQFPYQMHKDWQFGTKA